MDKAKVIGNKTESLSKCGRIVCAVWHRLTHSPEQLTGWLILCPANPWVAGACLLCGMVALMWLDVSPSHGLGCCFGPHIVPVQAGSNNISISLCLRTNIICDCSFITTIQSATQAICTRCVPALQSWVLAPHGTWSNLKPLLLTHIRI